MQTDRKISRHFKQLRNLIDQHCKSDVRRRKTLEYLYLAESWSQDLNYHDEKI